MVFKRRAGLLLSGTVLASIFVTAPSFAQDAQTDQMQRQINALQKQLQTLQSQVTETKQQAKAAQESAQTAQQSVQNIPTGLYNADVAVAPLPIKAAPSWFGGIHVSLAGSFIAMEGVWRQHNEISSGRQRSGLQHTAVSQLAALFRERKQVQRATEPPRHQGLGRHRPDAALDRLLGK